jgi:hypothetical protein
VPPSAFLEAIIAFLLPYFTPGAPHITQATDLQHVRSEIIETLASYATRTRSELLQAARIIAFGMTALDTLAEARTVEMSPSLRLRHRGCANSLNRSASLNEKALERSLANNPPLEPEQTPRQTDRPRANPQLGMPADPDRDNHLWAGAMIDTLARMGYPQHALAGR